MTATSDGDLVYTSENIVVGSGKAIMKFALNKTWLPADLQHNIWMWAHDTPHARIMRDVAIIKWQAPEHWALGRGLPMQQILLRPGVRMVAPLGYVCINPCNRCEFAEIIGSDHFCGTCRRRPMVHTTEFKDPFLGAHTRTCGYATPRAAYLRHRRYWDDSDADSEV